MMAAHNIPKNWQQAVNLAQYTTLKVGGPAEYFVSVTTDIELQSAIRLAKQNEFPITILGGGSNVLVDDDGVPGVVIRLRSDDISWSEEANQILLRCEAGACFDDVIAYTTDQGWWGLENLSAIPGTVGATPVQNVGAYGVEVADSIHSIEVYDSENDTFFMLSPTECEFGYRTSIFKTTKAAAWVITAVTFLLTTEPRPNLSYPDLTALSTEFITNSQVVRAHIQSVRAGKFPDWQLVGTAGSFFKNPIIPVIHYQKLKMTYPGLPGYPMSNDMVKVPLGWILDKVCGLRGYKDGAVGTYEKQALVLVQVGGATAADIYTVIDHISRMVRRATDIEITLEVTTLPSGRFL